MRLRVVTDSSTNVPDEYLKRLDICEVPAIVNFGVETYLNKVELAVETFYERLAAAAELPTTSQPTPGQFTRAFDGLAAEGAEEVIAVCVSGRMSGTLNSAQIAAESSVPAVHVWDSESASLGAGWQAIAAAEMARGGMAADAILDKLAGIRDRMQTATTPATLRYLVASGRVPRLRGAIGEILNVKPILSMVDAILDPVDQVRGRRRSLAAMVARIAEAVSDHPVRLGIAHANVPAEAAEFLSAVKDRINAVETILTDIGPALAALGGPGIIAVCVYTLEG